MQLYILSGEEGGQCPSFNKGMGALAPMAPMLSYATVPVRTVNSILESFGHYLEVLVYMSVCMSWRDTYIGVHSFINRQTYITFARGMDGFFPQCTKGCTMP